MTPDPFYPSTLCYHLIYLSRVALIILNAGNRTM